MARRIKQSNKLARSNTAHARLARRPQKRESDWINRSYHASVLQEQKKKGRILTRSEKESQYELARWYFFN